MRLIDVDELKRRIIAFSTGCHTTYLTVANIIMLLNQSDTVDAKPVVWKPVLGFEGLYEISSLGKVRNKNGEVLKQRIKRTKCTCYKTVDLWKDGRYFKKYIHRMIAEAFIPNPDNLPMVNHKDEDGTNNDPENLEWCTREYNVNYGTAKERRARKIRGVKHTEEHNRKISESLKQHYRRKASPNCGADMRGGKTMEQNDWIQLEDGREYKIVATNGKWTAIRFRGNAAIYSFCTKCGFLHPCYKGTIPHIEYAEENEYRFCPMCGRKMNRRENND